MNSGPLSSDSLNPGLAGKIIEFSNFLKSRGFNTSHSSIHDAVRSILKIDLSIREDFHAALRANLAKTDIEWRLFPELFLEFWNGENGGPSPPPEEEHPGDREGRESPATCEPLFEENALAFSDTVSDNRDKPAEETAYSPLRATHDNYLACFDKTDITAAAQAVKNIIRPFRNFRSRRFKKSKKTRKIDFPGIMRKSLKHEGQPIELQFKTHKNKPKRLVFLIDVSGSMGRYARLLLPFLLSLKTVGSKAETFVFSTSLVSCTFFIRNMNVDQIIDHISNHVPDWSGGTRIGQSLRQFNQGRGRRFLNRRTVIVILSDGWDLGEKELLRQEMKILNRNTASIIWLNPLAGDPEYRPLCQGMQAALPYIDHFLPANNLDDLKRAGLLINRLVTP